MVSAHQEMRCLIKYAVSQFFFKVLGEGFSITMKYQMF